MVQRQFSMLSETFRRQFGTNIYITLNHKKRELNFVFKTVDGDYLDTEINSLSGGEKSYAQVTGIIPSMNLNYFPFNIRCA